jgi:hypothetical protein
LAGDAVDGRRRGVVEHRRHLVAVVF